MTASRRWRAQVGYNLERPGTSGQIVGPACQIQDDAGNLLPPGSVGLIMLKGHPVTRGYENNPKANAESFNAGGWFMTGDMGKMDEDGYLYLTGRNKDVINRGGEIISPVEIDEALQTHPFVKNCLAFSTPHDLLQETIGVLIVPVPGVPRPGLKALQEYAARSLHSSKWPQLVVYADNLPKTTTAKAQRTSLDKRLGLPPISDSTPELDRTFEAQMVPPGTPIKTPISCALVYPDLSAVANALARPGRQAITVSACSPGCSAPRGGTLATLRCTQRSSTASCSHSSRRVPRM